MVFSVPAEKLERWNESAQERESEQQERVQMLSCSNAQTLKRSKDGKEEKGIVGGKSGGGTPGSIPNPAVKATSVDGSAGATLCESRPSPTIPLLSFYLIFLKKSPLRFSFICGILTHRPFRKCLLLKLMDDKPPDRSLFLARYQIRAVPLKNRNQIVVRKPDSRSSVAAGSGLFAFPIVLSFPSAQEQDS